ncbi:Uncharacterised protein [Mycobacteroides abscessus subsp. abscessus]|nr:hypothetical protein DDJ98_08620 [Mycobacteroides abscessus]SHP82389.1 Uncharacterised protein [Mycobacteroides abscessus subsp. abscessus]SKG04616.1 Uncharacterised protein [Mycobacteroides abscessus subsp. bolletii]SHQ13191.1 Uncharacterised protein [Mycobacteroides abscessus subsp. abscessus]SHQ26497.1 Uncharacterised protein [Mycobacteroides abscessus subsp. abscessus]
MPSKPRVAARDWSCADCGVDTDNVDGQGHDEYYMLHRDLWLEINPNDAGHLCIGCAESRLGRRLTRTDFTDAPVNTNLRRASARLTSRLAHPD